MGSPLGVAFANFYMCNVENQVLLNQNIAPNTYCRYVDDIFVVVRDENHLMQLKTAMEHRSVLKFTYELSVNSKIPFLDIAIDGRTDEYETTVYRKPTNVGRCLNAVSECPLRYKQSVIRSYLRRAHKTCNDWDAFHHEVARIKQILVNNGYSNTFLDEEIKEFLNKRFINHSNQNERKNSIKLYYCNQMNEAYATDERVLRQIIRDNVQCCNTEDRLDLVIYYKNKKVSNLIMKNNLTQDNRTLKRTNVIYKFSCPIEDCVLQNNANYIGMTRTTLSRRLTMHLQSGNIKTHMRDKHNSNLTREQLVSNTSIINHDPDFKRLQICEAILIMENNPSINVQITPTSQILTLFGTQQ